MFASNHDVTLKEPIRLLTNNLVQISSGLVAAIAIGRDRMLNNRLRALAAADYSDPFLVCQIRDKAWLKIDGSERKLSPRARRFAGI